MKERGSEQSRAEQSRAEQSRAEQSRAEQSKAKQSKAKQKQASAGDQCSRILLTPSPHPHPPPLAFVASLLHPLIPILYPHQCTLAMDPSLKYLHCSLTMLLNIYCPLLAT